MFTLNRRRCLGVGATLLLGACTALPPSTADHPPIVFVHGNGDSAALWQTTLWRFESNSWPRERLHAVNIPYPLARDVDAQVQAGRSSTADQMAYLKAEVEQVLKRTGARQVVLVANSRGGYAVRNYIQNGGGAETVSHAILAGTPNHGVWSVPGKREGNEFAGTGAFLKQLNQAKNPQGDEVQGPVRWLTIRSDRNDKFAQPDGLWIGTPGVATGVSYDGPELQGARNEVLPQVDHRETAFSSAAFKLMHRFITGQDPRVDITPEPSVQLSGTVTGLGVSSLDPSTGNETNNLPLPGARISVYAVDSLTGLRRGDAPLSATTAADGRWGPVRVASDTPLEFEIQAQGYAITHIYRSAFARSSAIVNLRPERVAAADQTAAALVLYTRPRGYFDAQRDRMQFDGSATLPGVPPSGAGVSSTRLKLAQFEARVVTAEFNAEKLVGRTWPLAQSHVTVLELTY